MKRQILFLSLHLFLLFPLSALAIASNANTPAAQDDGSDITPEQIAQNAKNTDVRLGIACAGEVNNNNSRLASGCSAYCKTATVSNCMDRCYTGYGYRESGGYIYDVTSFCTSPEQYQSWAAPPAPPVEASKPKIDVASDAPVDASKTPAKTPAEKPSDEKPDTKPVAKTEKPSSSSCSSDLSSAQNACGQQASTPSAQQGGINSSCQQMTNAGVNVSQQWGNIATSCSNAISKCKSSCSGDDLDSCSGLQSNLEYAQSMQTSSSSAAGNSGLGCQQQSGNGMNPSSTGGNGNGNSNSAPQAVAAATSVDCTNPVNASQCAVQKSQTAATDTTGNNTGMQEASGNTGSKGSGFNVGDPGTEKQNAQFGENQQQRGNQNGAGMNPMGGGSSSGFNFGGGNNNQNAGGPTPNRMAMNANKTAADVLHGEGSRSGYSSPVSRSIASISGRGGGMGGASFGSFGGGGGDMKDMRGLDLKQYLPGGSRDGSRRISGANFAHPDINNQNANMWVNVSNRFQVHCKLQLLYDCH